METKLKERLENLLNLVVDRKENLDKFMDFLIKESNFFDAPASTCYHLNRPQGLLEHSLNVAENMIKIKNLLQPDISDESCVIVGLFHDLGKGGNPGEPMYLENFPTIKQKEYGYVVDKPYKSNNNKVYMTVPHRSLFWLTKFIDLSQEEFQAIMIHDGQYVKDNSSYACKESKLSLIAHYADSWAGFQTEPINVKNEDGKGYHEEYPNKGDISFRNKGVWNK